MFFSTMNLTTPITTVGTVCTAVALDSIYVFFTPQTSLNPNNYLLSLVVSAGLTALMGYRQVLISITA